jgi:hypothetical protein
MTMQDNPIEQETNSSALNTFREYFAKYKTQIGMTILIIYVATLGLGTIGELWDVEWILDLPIFRPPGKNAE